MSNIVQLRPEARERLLLQVHAAQSQRFASGPVRLRIAGIDPTGDQAEALFTGPSLAVNALSAAGSALPETLALVSIFELDAARGWQLRSSQGSWDIQARSLQVHRAPTQAFYAALPLQVAPWSVRLMWAALLYVLRLPGAAALLARVRSR